MASEQEARLQGLAHRKEEWEKFFETREWREVTARGQAHADMLLNKMCHMEVSDLSGIIDLLNTRARLAGVLAVGLVAQEILREIDDEVDVVSNQGDES